MIAHDPDAPIGVFDSGVGGLTVARRVLDLLPNERIVYVADQAHVPYGGRELAEVRQFACGISSALFAYGCKAVVMACNISSAVALADVRALHPDSPVLGVIGPGACRAARTTKNGRVGVLATAGTVRTGAYSQALRALNADLVVTEVPCPEFVPLVESGEESSAASRRAAAEYLTPIMAIGADAIILGCTHYPFLLPALRSVWSAPAYVDPAEQTSRELAEQLASAALLAKPAPAGISAAEQSESSALLPGFTQPAGNALAGPSYASHPANTGAAAGSPAEPLRPANLPTNHARIDGRPSRHLLATTGDPEAFRQHLRRFLPDAIPHADILHAKWQDGRLHLNQP